MQLNDSFASFVPIESLFQHFLGLVHSLNYTFRPSPDVHPGYAEDQQLPGAKRLISPQKCAAATCLSDAGTGPVFPVNSNTGNHSNGADALFFFPNQQSRAGWGRKKTQILRFSAHMLTANVGPVSAPLKRLIHVGTN